MPSIHTTDKNTGKTAVLEFTPKDKILVKMSRTPLIIQFHCRLWLCLQEKLNSKECTCICRANNLQHYAVPKVYWCSQLLHKVIQVTSTVKERKLEWCQFSSDAKKTAFTKERRILLKLFWKLSVPQEYSVKHAFCKHIPKYKQTNEDITECHWFLKWFESREFSRITVFIILH